MNKPDLDQLRRAAMLQMLQKKQAVRKVEPSLAAIPAADRSAPLPLSFAQQRLWFIDQFDHAASIAYHLPLALRLEGNLNKAALRATLNHLLARHEALRTVFVKEDGVVQQKIAAEVPAFALQEHDLQGLDAAQQEARTAALLEADVQTPFELDQGPLIRGQLLQLGADLHVLLIVQHHIISDGWSIGVLVQEVSQLYAAFCQGQEAALPPLPLQYADYAAWQRATLQGEKLQQHVQFWENHLRGAPALLELPHNFPRPEKQSHAGARIGFSLPPATSAALRTLARNHDCTLFMVLLAGWAVLLARLAAQSEVVIGTPVANRQRKEIEGLLGFFVNTLALKVSLGEGQGKGMTVAQLLAKVKDDTLAAYAHQSLPFEQVVEALQPPRSLAHSPIFQVMFTLTSEGSGAAREELRLPGLSLSQMSLPHTSAHFDLTLEVSDVEGQLHGSLEYASDLFSAAGAQQIITRLQALLSGMAADAQQNLAHLPLLDAAERKVLLQDFNDTARAYPQKLIHQLFEEQAARSPDATALVYAKAEGEGSFEQAYASLSYAEVNARANRLAWHLRKLGVQPDQRIAICLPRGLEMTLGFLAILKAGAAYVPLDPGYPQDRLQHMLLDSAPLAVITLAAYVPNLPQEALANTRLVLLDQDADHIAKESADNLPFDTIGLQPQHLAYVIYTSGSTGLPKGVMVEHRNVVQLCINNHFAPLDEKACIAHCANPAFDASTWEIWGALLVGARTLIIPQPVLLDPRRFAQVLLDGGVNALFITIALFNQYADALASTLPHLDYVLFGGEQADLRKVKQVYANSKPKHLVHCYGPTETTTFATTWDIHGLSEQSTVLPIGGPLGNARIYILDANLQVVPQGVTGEIFIGGAGVARGYLQREDLTAERFIPDHITGQGKLYRTGDLARWLADGTIEYVGRNDFQVKIRGFRIELGEIENRLVECAHVAEALVIAEQDASTGSKRLAAYLVPEAGHELDVGQVRAELAAKLPEYMVPAGFFVLEAFPLNANGKIDRKALPKLDSASLLQATYVAPEGELESAIAGVWQELLGLPRIGRHDHFFELGGHSLLVVGMIEKLREHGVHTNVRSVFAAPTPAQLAHSIAAAGNQAAAGAVPANRIPLDATRITPDMLPLIDLSQEEIDQLVAQVPGGAANVQDIYPLAPLQDGILFHYMLGGEGDAYLLRTQLRFDNRACLDAFLAAMQQVIARHDILRTAMLWENLSRALQVVVRQAHMPQIAYQARDGQSALQVLDAHTDPRHVRMDLRAAPLLAAHFCPDENGVEWHLSLMAHHIVCDHVSMELIMEEVQLILQGRSADLPPAMPYRNFIAQIKNISQEEHETFFRSQLGDIDEPTAAFGVLDVQGVGENVEEAHLRLDDGLAQAIRHTAQAHGVPASLLFHIAWAQVLSLCSGRDDVVFGTVLSGRLQGAQGSDKVLGIFINSLPFRVSIGARSAQQVLRETWDNMRQLLVHEQASLALAQRCSNVAAGLPLFTSLLNCRHSHVAEVEDQAERAAWEGIHVVASEERTNYPLTVSVDDLGRGFSFSAQAVQGIHAQRMLGYLQTAVQNLIRALQDDAAHSLQANLLPSDEYTQLVQTWNDTARAYPQKLIHQLFEEQAARSPDATALVYAKAEGEGSFEQAYASLSYAEVNARANRLAWHLRKLGVQPDQRIAICLPRGLEMTLGFLAILKAGAAYVPLDPGYPQDRLQHMLLDSAPLAVITLAAYVPNLPQEALANTRLVLLDQDADHIAKESADNLPFDTIGLQPQHLAYVIYTSGSTGLPKGVMVEHRNVVQLCINNHFAPLDEKACIAHCANPAFDASTWEIWGALLVGARTLIIPQPVLLDPRRFAQVLLDGGVNALFITIALFNQYADALASTLPHLDYVLFGGEQADLRKVKQVYANSKPKHLVHCYGPTETTTFATTWDIHGLSEQSTVLPIGGPLGNACIYILDQHLQVVPQGVTGEIFIGGAGVARGYLQREDLTAERFIPDHITGQGKLYKTGDLARWLPDGTIEYVGRNDFQVKIRGFRIELGEIENRLVECAHVAEALVIAEQDASTGSKRLAAYLVPETGCELDVGQVRAELAAKLPEYMVPAGFFVLDAFPLNANGKIDRKVLPKLADAGEELQSGRPYQAPEGAVEQQLAAIWRDLLGVSQVGRHDHFFELGGHSLLVVGMIEKLRQHGWQTDVRSVFKAGTLAALAQILQEQQALPAHSSAATSVPANPLATPHQVITPQLLPLVQLSQEEIDALLTTIPGGAPNLQDAYPLAPLQEGILFHYLLGGTGDAYLLRTVISFESGILLDKFLHGLQGVIARHDILRTGIRWQGLATPLQVVLREAQLPRVDCTPVPGMSALDSLLQASDPRHLRLDLQQAPLLAAYTIADQDGRYHLALMAHHIICDHVTQDLMLNEIQVMLQGRADSLPAPQPYRNFIAHTRAVSAQAHEAYFKEQLGALDSPCAPFGVLEVQGDGEDVSEDRRELDPELGHKLRTLARQHNLPPAVIFHLAWARVLSLCCNRSDVVFGTVLSGRMQGTQGADQVMGLFINTLPLRVNLHGLSVQQALQATWRQMGDLLQHEQASLALAQRCSGLAPNQPLFTSLLNYRHSIAEMEDAEHVESGESIWEGYELHGGEERSNYPLTVSVDDMGSAFYLSAQCAPGISPQRMLDYFAQALHGLAQHLQTQADSALARVSILAADEWQTLQAWAGDERPYPQHGSIAAVFAHRVQEQPQAPALIENGVVLSYAELEQQANRLAHYLLQQGVQPEQCVALHLPRSSALVVAMLAVLKAGAAYLPLEVDCPPQRLQHILQEAQATLVLSNTALQTEAAVRVLSMAQMQEVLATWPTSAPALHANGASLAYVIYTSGSTGTPKGVMVEQRSVLRLVCNNHYAPLDDSDCVALCANPAFDATTWEVWGALLNGARLLVVDQETLLAPQRLNQQLIAAQVSAMWLTVGLFNAYQEALGAAFAQMKYLLIGGDALDPRSIAALQQRGQAPRHLLNGYGPTETTTFATTHEIGPVQDARLPIPLGKPLANTRIYLVDQDLQLLPPGVAGEILIGGPGVARGYLARPDLSAERFVEVDFAPGQRFYRSGDLGCWREDGVLEYLGRNDQQVKIRGYRIELSEIEARLAALPGVAQAVLQLDQEQDGQKRLLAWVSPQAGHSLQAAALRNALAQQVPDYMLPAAFCVLDTWPLTANGKIDKRALPQPQAQDFVLRAFVAPQGEWETRLAAIWAEVLQQEQVGRDDHFFELGGHSLLAVQMLAHLRHSLGQEAKDIPLRLLFAHPHLEAFAAACTAHLAGELEHSNLVVLRSIQAAQQANAGQAELPLFLIHPGEGEVAYARDLADLLPASLPVYALAASGLQAGESASHSVPEMAARYLQAVRSVQAQGPYRLGGWSGGGTIAYEMARQLLQDGHSVECVALLDTVCDYRHLPAAPGMPQAANDSGSGFDAAASLLWRLPHALPAALRTELNTLAAQHDLAAMLALCQQQDLLPQELDAATLERHLAVAYGILFALRNYQVQAQPSLARALHLFIAGEQAHHSPDLGWAQAGVQPQSHQVAGDHQSMMEMPHRVGLAAQLYAVLQQTENMEGWR